jgi:Holliday junction resolvasome RuvABC DNA-binding subunit
MTSESVAFLQLIQTKGIGPRTVARIMRRLEEDRLSLQDFLELNAHDVAARFDLS